MEDVFNFDEFLNGKLSRPIIKESVEEEKVPTEVTNFQAPVAEKELTQTNEVTPKQPEYKEPEQVMGTHIEEFVSEPIHTNESADDNYYKLYKDINEEFVCDIAIEGSSPEETYARIIVESDEWSLMFPGEIRNGKCIVPIKKLGILKEGEIGTIKLEVVAEGNLFIPWQDEFKVKLSKKVTVSLNENRNQPQRKPLVNNKVGVKVNVR
jgi:hypothetical protein